MLPQAGLEGTLIGFLEFWSAIRTGNVGRGRGQETRIICRVGISSSVNVTFLAAMARFIDDPVEISIGGWPW
jgi:hypothetical protein